MRSREMTVGLKSVDPDSVSVSLGFPLTFPFGSRLSPGRGESDEASQPTESDLSRPNPCLPVCGESGWLAESSGRCRVKAHHREGPALFSSGMED